jgi:hypothetical protein
MWAAAALDQRCSSAVLHRTDEHQRAHQEQDMAEQTIPRDAMQARRELLVCRACGGDIWHFDIQAAPGTDGPIKLIGYRCAGCGARIDVPVDAPAPGGESDRAG